MGKAAIGKVMKKKEPQGERVRKATSDKRNEVIDKTILRNIKEYAGKSPDEISQRIKTLDKEWDIERVLDLNMSALALCWKNRRN